MYQLTSYIVLVIKASEARLLGPLTCSIVSTDPVTIVLRQCRQIDPLLSLALRYDIAREGDYYKSVRLHNYVVNLLMTG